MRIRWTASCFLLAGIVLAGCDRCLDCRCTCDHHTAAGLQTKIVTSRHGFDCGQTCRREENCGTGDVVASECLRTTRVDGRTDSERCARADATSSRP